MSFVTGVCLLIVLSVNYENEHQHVIVEDTWMRNYMDEKKIQRDIKFTDMANIDQMRKPDNMKDMNLFIVVYYNEDQSGRESWVTVTKNQDVYLWFMYGLWLMIPDRRINCVHQIPNKNGRKMLKTNKAFSK